MLYDSLGEFVGPDNNGPTKHILPNWPARLSEETAAEYLSISQTSFRKRVAEGLYPQSIREGGRIFWSRLQLDKFVAGQFGLAHSSNEGDDSWADLK